MAFYFDAKEKKSEHHNTDGLKLMVEVEIYPLIYVRESEAKYLVVQKPSSYLRANIPIEIF